MVQTGPNSQFGGLKAGLVSPAYQVGIDGSVAAEPIAAAARVTSRQTIRVTMDAPPRCMEASRVMDDPMVALPGPVERDDMGCSRLNTIAGQRSVSWLVPYELRAIRRSSQRAGKTRFISAASTVSVVTR